MKKTSLLIGTALLLGVHTATAAEDYTCATPPSCTSLGYNQTADDCNGRNVLKCPFDPSQVFCAKLNEIADGVLYKNGDGYYKDGNLLGYVFDGTDCTDGYCLHGKIYKGPFSADTYDNAIAFCENYVRGGKQWRLPYSEAEYTIISNDSSKILFVGETEKDPHWVINGRVHRNVYRSLIKMKYPNFCSSLMGYQISDHDNEPCSEEKIAKVKESFHCVTEF